MKAGHDPAGAHLWAIVAATVRPFPGRVTAEPESGATLAPPPPMARASTPAKPPARPPAGRPPLPPQAIEPGRHRRLLRGRASAPVDVDLHGLDQGRARAALTAFLLRAHAEGTRTVLVITGKGALGDGVLRRHVPQWLAEAPLRPLVAGLSEAHRRHGGEGALYVALRRRGR